VSLIPVKDWCYLGIIVAVAAGLLWWHHSAVLEGEAKVHAAEQAAYAAQAAKDAQNAKETVSGLNAEIEQLRSDALKPIPVVRLCNAPRVQPPAASDGGNAVPAPGWSVPSVSAGDPGGDIGPSLLKLAAAADLIAARNRALIEWAKK